MSQLESRGGPYLLLLPLFGGLCAVLWLQGRRPPHLPPAAPPVNERALEVDGFSGTARLGDALELGASLARLHADPERQRFDACALAGRLQRPGLATDGEPWRLCLELAPEAGADDVALRVERVRVVDEHGVALAPLLRTDVAPDDVADPLLVLLAPPDAPLAPGETLDVFLWGREPGDGARIEGLLDPRTQAALPLALARRRVLCPSSAGAMARLERDGEDDR